MTHYAAYVITGQLKPADRQPDNDQLRAAVLEAQKIAEKAISARRDEQANPESLGLGTTQYRMIQGNLLTNYNTFAPMPQDQWPQCSEDFWSEAKGRTKNAAKAPEHIIDSSWNTGGALITMALEYHNMERQPYPQVLITPEGEVTHHVSWPDADVFGDRDPGGTAAKFSSENAAQAWHAAAEPLRDLAKASFRVDYLRTLAGYTENIIVALDWNV